MERKYRLGIAIFDPYKSTHVKIISALLFRNGVKSVNYHMIDATPPVQARNTPIRTTPK
jgi:hypothetical protein